MKQSYYNICLFLIFILIHVYNVNLHAYNFSQIFTYPLCLLLHPHPRSFNIYWIRACLHCNVPSKMEMNYDVNMRDKNMLTCNVVGNPPSYAFRRSIDRQGDMNLIYHVYCMSTQLCCMSV